MMRPKALCLTADRSIPTAATRPCAARSRVGRVGIVLASIVGAALALLAAANTGQADDPRQESQQRLEQMSEAEKTALLQKKRRFDDLSAAEQDRLRLLHNQLLADPQQEELQGVLERYANWLRTLAPRERAEVTDLPTDKRVEKIRELMRAQDAKRFRMMASGFMLSPHDLSVVHDWFDQFIDDHASEILDALPDEMFGKLKKEYKPERDRAVLRRLYFGPGAPNLPRPTPQDEAQLQTRVSKEAANMLAKVTAEERTQIIQRWTGAAVFSRMRSNPSTEELQAFQESKEFQDSLSPSERSRLEGLPPDRLYRELRHLYSLNRFGGAPDRGPPWGRRGGEGQRRSDGGRRFEGPRPDGPGGPPPWDFPGKPPHDQQGWNGSPPAEAAKPGPGNQKNNKDKPPHKSPD
ncbi:MAG: hypothetical protein ACYC0X_10555 [Pirellulaceae bacterium]